MTLERNFVPRGARDFRSDTLVPRVYGNEVLAIAPPMGDLETLLESCRRVLDTPYIQAA